MARLSTRSRRKLQQAATKCRPPEIAVPFRLGYDPALFAKKLVMSEAAPAFVTTA
jgi:hypothetical protein